MEDSNKKKISSDFIYAKLVTGATILILLLLLTDYRRTDFNTLIEYVVMFFALSLFFIYISTRPEMFYDTKNLYVRKRKENIVIPLNSIQSISHSKVGFGLSAFSYNVKYVVGGDIIKSCRIMPSLFGSSIRKLIDCIEKENPKAIINRGVLG